MTVFVKELKELKCRNCNIKKVNLQVYNLLQRIEVLDLGDNQVLTILCFFTLENLLFIFILLNSNFKRNITRSFSFCNSIFPFLSISYFSFIQKILFSDEILGKGRVQRSKICKKYEIRWESIVCDH